MYQSSGFSQYRAKTTREKALVNFKGSSGYSENDDASVTQKILLPGFLTVAEETPTE